MPSQNLSFGVKDAARAVGVSPATMWNLIRAGEVKPTRIGGRTLVQRGELESLLNRSTAA
ncbi:MAG: helix-turn-helix domain-containing protein [Erythrobacter sp.]